ARISGCLSLETVFVMQATEERPPAGHGIARSWPEKYKFQPDGVWCSMRRDSAVTSEMSHRLVALGLMVALAGCGSSSPAPVPSTVGVPSPVPVQLSGVATDDDASVSGVSVFVYPWNGPAGLGNAVTTVTDTSGRYSVTFNSLLTPGGTYPSRFTPRK